LLRPRTSPIGMVRIRHPNLFVDKRDIIWAKMPTFCEKLFSACRKFIILFFMHLRRFRCFLLLQFIKVAKIYENPAKNCQVRNSPPQIEGLGVVFLPFSGFRGRICWF
jgi:hypothetical protein